MGHFEATNLHPYKAQEYNFGIFLNTSCICINFGESVWDHHGFRLYLWKFWKSVYETVSEAYVEKGWMRNMLWQKTVTLQCPAAWVTFPWIVKSLVFKLYLFIFLESDQQKLMYVDKKNDWMGFTLTKNCSSAVPSSFNCQNTF